MAGENKRIFVYMDQNYDDPGVEISNEQVLAIMARTYGNLQGGSIEVAEKKGADGDTYDEVTLKPRAKQLGAGEIEAFLVGLLDCEELAAVPEKPEIPEMVSCRELWGLIDEWYLAREARDGMGHRTERIVSICRVVRPVPQNVVVIGI